MKTYVLKNQKLTIDDFVSLCSGNGKIKLSLQVKRGVAENRKKLEKIIQKRKIYGINTGFGALSNKTIPEDKLDQLQVNLIRSHACGCGKMLEPEIAKGMLFLLLNSLSKGYSGVRLELIETLVKIFNKNIVPLIPEKGSVGGSGDLVPLAHLALLLIGEGEALYQGKKIKGKEILTKAGIRPLKLKEKEGLALINGTHLMTSMAAFAVWQAENLVKIADIASAMSTEALLGTDKNFLARIHKLKPHPGQLISAKNLRKLLAESEIVLSHRRCPRIQDVYSLRCIPQVHGASRETVNFAKKIVETEMNSVTDNPLIFPDGVTHCVGHFHGQPVAFACDFLGIAMAELADISERRIAQLLNSGVENLPLFLVKDGGLNSGLMISQYTAASLVSQNKILAHPASVDSIPTSAGKEDHVSMGTIAANTALEILCNSENVLAIELLAASQALDFHKPKRPGKGTKKAYETIRKFVPFVKEDRVLAKDINKIYQLITNGILLKEVGKITGPLI